MQDEVFTPFTQLIPPERLWWRFDWPLGTQQHPDYHPGQITILTKNRASNGMAIHGGGQANCQT